MMSRPEASRIVVMAPAIALMLSCALVLGSANRVVVDVPLSIRVNINDASASELQMLPGIGPALADRIVADRMQSGPFRSAADLTRVRGIGDRTVVTLKPYVESEPTPADLRLD